MARGNAGAPVRPGETVEIPIHDLGHAGEGVGRVGGFTVFVPGAVPGDRVRVRIGEVKKNHARASLLAVAEPSPHRVQAPCPVFDACGGCQLQALSYAEQLRWKTARVEAAVHRIGGLTGVTVHPCRGMDDPWRYRGKAQFPVGMEGSAVVAGFYASGSHDIVDVSDCLIQHPVSNRIMQEVKRLVSRYAITPYNEQAHTGVLRHVLARVSGATGEAMAVLITRSAHLPNARELSADLMQAVPEVVSVVQNVNPARTNVVLGEESRVLAGKAAIEDRIGDLRFLISPRSFFQVNPAQAGVLYDQVLAFADLSGSETVLDLYCGTGTIALYMARRAARVIGVEVVPEAVRDAEANAQLNGIDNAHFVQGEAEMVLPQLAVEGLRAAVVVLDPPRRGCEPAVLEGIVQVRPDRITYVSCNPSTLVRDLAFLAERGYRTAEVQPVDVFPQTAHVECCALLMREDSR